MSYTTTAPVPPAFARARDSLQGRTIAVLTGAGISADSGIPTYRGAGTKPRTPMTAQRFLTDENARRRYWVGSHLGWRLFDGAEPNVGHRALAALERAGMVAGVVTQNVDGLHLAAGSARVVELHGTMRRVLCLQCGQVFDRRDIASRIEQDNPWITHSDEVVLGPDGDVLPDRIEGFRLPMCTVCEGTLRPDIVFFGEYVPPERFRAAESILQASDALLIAGTSLVVNSGVRLVERARRRGIPIVLINREPTKVDRWASAVLSFGTSEALPAIARALTGSDLDLSR